MIQPCPLPRMTQAIANLLILLFLAYTPLLQAQEAPAPETDAGVSRLQAQRQALENDATLTDASRASALELINKAIEEQRATARLETEITQLRERLATAPDRILELQQEVDQSRSTAEPGDYSGLPQDALLAQTQQTESALESARERLRVRERVLAEITALGPSLTAQLAQHREALRALPDAATRATGEAEAIANSRQAQIEARRARVAAEISKAELQLENYDLLLQLASLERDSASARLTSLDRQREQLVSALEHRRVEDARLGTEDARQAKAATSGLPEVVAQIAADNAALRQELENLTRQSAQSAEKLRSSERHLSELDAALVSMRERLADTGPTTAIGRLLRRHLQSVQEIKAQRSQPQALDNEITRITDRRIELSEQRRELADTQVASEALLVNTQDAAALREPTRQLLRAKRSAIDALHQAYGRYLTQLTSLQATERQLTITSDSIINLVRREHLWIRSLPPLSLSDLTHIPTALTRLLNPMHWTRAATDTIHGFRAHPLLAPLGLATILVLIALRGRAIRQLESIARQTRNVRTDQFQHTLRAAALTIMLVATWPLLVAHLGWLMSTAADAAVFSQHLGQVLLTTVAQLLIIITGTRWVVHPQGLARQHFAWPEPVCRSLHNELRWLMLVTILCAVAAGLAELDGSDALRLAAGRPATMLFFAALMVFVWRLLRPSGRLVSYIRQEHPNGLATRTWKLWFPALLAIPVISFFATASGYLYTAGVATGLLIKTGWLILLVAVLRGIMLRWFTVSERRLRFERLMAQREEARAERARRQEEGLEATVSEVTEVEIPEVDFRELGLQGRAIIQVVVMVGAIFSLWALWADLLPALNVLESIHLPIHRSVIVDGIEQVAPVTLVDLGIVLLVLGGAIFAAKNLSGLLGFTLLRRVAGDAGAQYAIITLCQYVLVGGGIIYALAGLGVQWSKLQWLVAALGVGLGFGLQEIVANFVSGIILLLERPIRVGDTVTVGDATGTVSRIRIRATTIVDWDRKELVVPNKEFVTGRLLNWTLSNSVLRLVVPVGIAYGSDARRARTLLLEVAQEHEQVLDDPAPIVAFTNFGDNALGLELRVYLPSIEYFSTTRTDLHDAIYEKFNEAGIPIAFPQRDVHLNTSSPLEIRLHQDATKNAESQAVVGADKPPTKIGDT